MIGRAVSQISTFFRRTLWNLNMASSFSSPWPQMHLHLVRIGFTIPSQIDAKIGRVDALRAPLAHVVSQDQESGGT
jgi:hypothetical protein